jgi:hypothetical protein
MKAPFRDPHVRFPIVGDAAKIRQKFCRRLEFP